MCLQTYTADVQILDLNKTYSYKNICTIYVFSKTAEKMSKHLSLNTKNNRKIREKAFGLYVYPAVMELAAWVRYKNIATGNYL